MALENSNACLKRARAAGLIHRKFAIASALVLFAAFLVACSNDTPEVNEFVQFVQGTKLQADRSHEYASSGIKRLAAALGAINIVITQATRMRGRSLICSGRALSACLTRKHRSMQTPLARLSPPRQR